MFRAFAITLALTLAAALVLFLVADKAARQGWELFPAWPQWGVAVPVHLPMAGAIGMNRTPNPAAAPASEARWHTVQARDMLPGPSRSVSEPDPNPNPSADRRALESFLLRALLAFVLIAAVLGGVILDQAAGILEIPRRGPARAAAAMTMSCAVFLSTTIIVWGLVYWLLDLPLNAAPKTAVFFAFLFAIALPGILGVLRHSFHTTLGKSLFLLISYRFTLTFSLATTGLACWLVMSGNLTQGAAAVTSLLNRV